MADGTKIEWTDATWNPITGCSVVSPGCTNCYAMKLAGTRLKNHESRMGLTKDTKAGPVWTGEVRFNAEWLDQPLRWTKPRMIFVCAHGDLFAEGVPDEWIDQVFAVMALCPQHTFQVLTKRPERMREYLRARDAHERILESARLLTQGMDDRLRDCPIFWPLRNIWLGVSVEDQRRADERIPILLDTPAAIRWISAEPLLGQLKLGQYLALECTHEDADVEWDTNAVVCKECENMAMLDWVVVGGESGPGARPMHPDWARSLRDQCAAENVPFLFKQWGEWLPRGPESLGYPVVEDVRTTRLTDRGENGSDLAASGENHVWMQRLGKRRAGRMLDGVEHNGYPEVCHG